ncbi:MAG: hypothetical protein AAGH68_08410 [Pseudomonadota bacterium]
MLSEIPRASSRYLTSAETVELARIQQDNSVIGYALLTLDGDEIQSGGAWSSMLGPVFGNITDIADQLGEDLGEDDICPMAIFESPDFEVACLLLSSARVIIIKRKPRRKAEGLRSVGSNSS